ncbi:diacylglycerol kinase [Neisseria polysaccharea]|uniref:diacylglycerol kinase n=1 Tax=Neisseria polysaccharea TaxID=489 RepID=UPI00272D03B2|nr:diacylglycerol kinase [Neisseria polysaccharea]
MKPSSYATGKKGKSGIRRVINAFGYSIDGIAAAYRYEAAFRQVLWLNVLLVCAAFFGVSETSLRLPLVIASFVSVIVELVNTAIEAAVDHTSTDRHELAKRAKDAGSAAQLVAMLMLAAVWLSTLFG